MAATIGWIGLNVLFDWLLVGGPTPWGNQSPFNFGAPGLVLATVAINVLTCLLLLLTLQRRLEGLPLREWGLDAARLALATGLATCASWSLMAWVVWPSGWIGLIWQIAVPASLGLLVYWGAGTAFGNPEVTQIAAALRRRLRRR